jgi:hypothetical protein
MNTERFISVEMMVERGLKISESNVEHLAAALDRAATERWLFAENGLLGIQSRLVQYAFLHACTRGHPRVVSRLLKSGILDTISGMPDFDFIQGLHESTLSYDEAPPDDTIATSSAHLGPSALILALGACRYRSASLLIEHGVSQSWGVSYLMERESAVLSLTLKIDGFRQRGETPPNHLDLLKEKLLVPATLSFYNGRLPKPA